MEPVARIGTDVSPDQVEDGTFVLLDAAGRAVPGDVRHDRESRSLVFGPDAPLEADATYTAVVRAGLVDGLGHRLSRDISWRLHTAPDRRPPRVRRRVPRPGAITVGADAEVAVAFSEPLAPGSGNEGVLELRDPSGATVEGRVERDREGRTLTFHPFAPLRGRTTYRAVLRAGLRDRAGNAMAESSSWSFTTAGQVRPRRD